MSVTMLPMPGSSNIKEMGHDAETNTLYVTFQGGARYSYADVPRALYTKGVESDSPGKWLHAEIKGKFKHERLKP